MVNGALSAQEVTESENEITALIKEKNCAPILIRLACHDCGTYDKSTCSNGFFRKSAEASHGANAGLDIARNLLSPL